uniref:RNase H type-1 domain-containing protein n=1 Tax=Cannabis sativa TaxID=3483 RepID=A0A803Q9T7_CANSA
MKPDELRAILLALQFAKALDLPNVIIELDSEVAVKGLHLGSLPFGWGSYPVFVECINLCREFKFVDVVFISRCVNVAADLFARWAQISKIRSRGSLREVAPFMVTILAN